MSSPLEGVKQLLASKKGVERKALLRELHEIVVSGETPEETALRISLYPAQISAARIGHDLKIFQTLAASGSKSLEELLELTKANPITLARLLRYMASVGLIHEDGPNQFSANKECQNLADAQANTIVTHFFANCSPLFQEMPSFLRKNNYKDVTDGKDTVFQPAYNTDLDTYTYFAQHTDNRDALIKYMALEQAVRGRWLEEYPIESHTAGSDASQPIFVDIGGNVGHYCAIFKKRFPNVAGRVILQDLASTLAHALPTPGVESLAHDFFTPQPIKGAKFYHLGWVLHNWNDERSKEIVRQIKSAMTPDSILLINDMVLPAAGVPAYSAGMDLIMLGACGSRERNMKEWEEILGEAGLKIKECIVYDPESCHGIIAATLA